MPCGFQKWQHPDTTGSAKYGMWNFPGSDNHGSSVLGKVLILIGIYVNLNKSRKTTAASDLSFMRERICSFPDL